MPKADLEKLRTIGTLRSGYKKATKETVKDSRGSKQVEHFDGRVDAVIRPKSLKLKATKKGDN